MSTSSDTASSVSAQGQADPAAPDGAFTLISSDGKHHHIDSALLASASKVFADMLDTADESGGPKQCDVTEDSHAVSTFLAAIKDQTVPDTQEDWLGLYRMMDKYDAKSLKSVLLVRGWETVKLDPLYAYGAGAMLGEQKLMIAAADGCLGVDLSVATSTQKLLFEAAYWLPQLRLPDIDVVKEMSDKLLKSVLTEKLCTLCSHNLCSDMKDFQEAWATACAKITLV
ncbi:hypothetical protein JCM10450v2_005357 [Rhodotorula kratochvilovae]